MCRQFIIDYLSTDSMIGIQQMWIALVNSFHIYSGNHLLNGRGCCAESLLKTVHNGCDCVSIEFDWIKSNAWKLFVADKLTFMEYSHRSILHGSNIKVCSYWVLKILDLFRLKINDIDMRNYIWWPFKVFWFMIESIFHFFYFVAYS